jgi:hypothetical protein
VSAASASSLGLAAPAAVSVELRTGDRRLYRLSREIGLGGIRLGRPAPFEPGQPLTIRFALPGATLPLELEAEVGATGDPAEDQGEGGGCALYFRDQSPELRSAVSAYIADRLDLPPLPPLPALP